MKKQKKELELRIVTHDKEESSGAHELTSQLEKVRREKKNLEAQLAARDAENSSQGELLKEVVLCA